MEGLHCVGLSLLVFRVLPGIDVVRGVMILSCTCMLPSILKPICSSTKNSQEKCSSVLGKMVEFLLDLIATLAQLSAIPVVVLFEYYINEWEFAKDHMKIVELSSALFLCSFSWWENFIDDRFCGALKDTNALQIAMLGLKFDLQECRPMLFTLAAPVKAAVCASLAYFLRDPEIIFNLGEAIKSLSDQTHDIRLNTSIVVLVLSAFAGHYTAYTACKLQMQIVSYSIPLLLSTPTAVAIVYFDCQYNFLSVVSQEVRSCDSDFLHLWWHLPLSALWFISVYWIGRHIWYPTQERLAKSEK